MWVTLVAAARARWVRGLFALGVALSVPVIPTVRVLAQAADAGVSAAQAPEEPIPSYGAVARIKPPAPEPEKAFSGTETKTLEHALGASFAVEESLPGTVPVFSGVPYLIIRGATPSGSLTYYDGLELPALFHLALGPSIIHPELVGATEFYAGVAPARFAPHIGGVLSRSGPGPRPLPARHLQLSLLDVSGYLNAPTEQGGLSVAWRYGNPGVVLSALGLDATLGYYDYQLRYQTHLGLHTRLLVLALGDGDQLGDRTAPQDDIRLSFHRLMLRLTRRTEQFELNAQLALGVDVSTLGQALSGDALRAQPQLYADWFGRRTRLRVGAELSAALARLRHGRATPVSETSGQSARTNSLSLDPEDFLDGQPFTSVPSRSRYGAYTDLRFEPGAGFELQLSARADAFVTGNHIDAAVSPALRVRHHTADWLSLHAGIALAHKPRTSPLPIPGLTDVTLDAGIEQALQTEAGAELSFGRELTLDATAFYHRYIDVVYLELILDCQGNTDPAAAQALLTRDNPLASICRRTGLPTANGESHGLELFLKRDLGRHLTGFVAYTLAFATATARDGTDFTPQGDVRHVLNAVLSYDLGAGFTLGLRLHFRTGKMAVNTIFDVATDEFQRVEYRLPSFVRADAHASYAWDTSFGRLQATLGIQNFTFSREATNRDCQAMQGKVHCTVDYQPYIVLPNVGVRADF